MIGRGSLVEAMMTWHVAVIAADAPIEPRTKEARAFLVDMAERGLLQSSRSLIGFYTVTDKMRDGLSVIDALGAED